LVGLKDKSSLASDWLWDVGHLLKVPEVLIKLGAGILLMAFGTFWVGEGLGWNWPLGELMLLC